MSYADKTITCRDCGTSFVFTTGEQDFYAQKGFASEPTRCPACRQARKANGGSHNSWNDRGSAADSYSRSSYQNHTGADGESYDDRHSFSRGSYNDRGSYSSRGGYDRGEREMHSVECSACGREAQVPFVPRGDRPVYCSDCFRQQRQSSVSRPSTRW